MRLIESAIARVLAGLAFLALLGGCTMVRISYNNAQPLVRYVAHDYFDLDERQSGQFRNALQRFHEWHRANELPRYARLLRTAAARGENRIARDDLVWAAAEVRARYLALVTKALNDAAPILATLAPAQIAELERRLAKANEEYAEKYLNGDEDRRFRAQAKRLLARFEDWAGAPSEAQEDRINRFARAHMATTQMRFENRRRWQQEAVELLRRYRAPKELATRISDIFVQPESHRLPEYVRARAVWEADLFDLLLDLDRTLTAEQRARSLGRMRRYAEDFEALSAERDVAWLAPAD